MYSKVRAHRGCFDRIGLRQSGGRGDGRIICFLLLFLFCARVIITVAAAVLMVGGVAVVVHAHTHWYTTRTVCVYCFPLFRAHGRRRRTYSGLYPKRNNNRSCFRVLCDEFFQSLLM